MQVGPLSQRQLGLIIGAGGLALALVSVLAEPLGIGSGGGIHGRQIAGIVVGVLGIVVGLALVLTARATQAPRTTAAPPPAEPSGGEPPPPAPGES